MGGDGEQDKEADELARWAANKVKPGRIEEDGTRKPNPRKRRTGRSEAASGRHRRKGSTAQRVGEGIPAERGGSGRKGASAKPEADGDPWGDLGESYYQAAERDLLALERAAQGRKRKAGKPAFVPTAQQRRVVLNALGYGLPIDQCRLLVLNPHTGRPIDDETFVRVFKEEREVGRAKANYIAMGNLLRHTYTAPVAAIFWAKSQLGWQGDKEEDALPNSAETMSPREVARRVAFVLNAAVMNVQINPAGGVVPVRNEDRPALEGEKERG
jgi:hypothetical protein